MALTVKDRSETKAQTIVLGAAFSGFASAGAGRAAVREEAPPETDAPDLEAMRREAFAAGEAQARRELAALDQRRQRCWALLESQLEAYGDRLEQYVNEQTVALALGLCETLLRHALPDAAMLKTLLQDIVGHIVDLEKIRVRLHPDDAALLTGGGASAELGAHAGRIELAADPSLAPGDLIIENGFGQFDARMAQRLDLARAQLTERLAKFHAHHD